MAHADPDAEVLATRDVHFAFTLFEEGCAPLRILDGVLHEVVDELSRTLLILF